MEGDEAEMVRQANGEIEMVCHDLWPCVCFVRCPHLNEMCVCG